MASQYPAVPPNASARVPIPTPTPSSNMVPSQSLMDRTGRFIEKNRNLLLIGATVAVSAGAGYYYYTRSASDDNKPGSSSDGSSAASKSKKKKKGKKSKFVKGEGLEGPLLEEIQQPEAEDKAKSEAKTKVAEEPAKPAADAHLADLPDQAALASMSESDRNTFGATLKDRGNKLYSKKEFAKAVECYTKAIEISVKRDAVFFSNRAACFTNYDPPQYDKVVEDCSEALKLDRTYTKALKRRATAYEHLGQEENAVVDFTACTILEGFKDEAANKAIERCLPNLAKKKVAEQFTGREPKLPSPTFVSSYLAAFRPRDKPTLPENPSQGDQTLLLAFDALSAADYAHAVTFVNEAIEQGISWTHGQAEAYNLRGTFKFLMNDSTGAKADLEKSLDLWPEFVQSWVKIASVHMELGDEINAFGDFEAAIRYNPNDPDIYYHRGQVYFVKSEFDKAIADYTKSTELDGDFIFTHIQHAVAQYKQNNVASSMAAFRRILKQFPERGEPSNYYGELLLDSQKFSESVERFDRSIELDKNNRPRNVLPLVNKALALFQWKQDVAQAEQLCRQALDIDPDCDVAIATLAQFALQQGKLDQAIEWFERSSKLARTEGEFANAITYEYASRAQKQFIENYPEYAERLSQPVPM